MKYYVAVFKYISEFCSWYLWFSERH